MATVISCINLKGGVGKTALAVNLAAYCGKIGKKTLLIDLDPQTNASFSMIGVQKWTSHAKTHGTVADLLGAQKHVNAEGKRKKAGEVLFKEAFSNVDLIPSHIDLFTVDLDMAGATSRETKLRKATKELIDDYDIIVCDCPPNLTIPTQNALALSTHYVVPVSLDFLSAIGISLLIKRVEELSDDLEHDIAQVGIVISRVGRPAIHREETEATLRDEFGQNVLERVIRERVQVSQAAQKNVPIFDFGNTPAAKEFSTVCADILARIGITNK